jgi:hypothetical protein
MKKILFLSFNYPNGDFGPSTNCSFRIMKKLCETGRYEVHCVSYLKSDHLLYENHPAIKLHQIPIEGRSSRLPYWLSRVFILLDLPFYPWSNLLGCYRRYKATRKAIINDRYDLVICQCYPFDSLLTGIWLKKKGFISKLLVIFWDNIYGMVPQRFIPHSFALRRQIKAESFVAKYADRLISLYPLRAFHEKYGDIPLAKNKRSYLGIPSIIAPQNTCIEPRIVGALSNDKINFLYSGTIFREEYVVALVSILNQTSFARNINLILFQKGISLDSIERIRMHFNGSVFNSDWVPLCDLLSLYPRIDFFLSFPGSPTAIRSKVFEYMSYGKPLILLFDNENDVNLITFKKYPAFFAIDTRASVELGAQSLEPFIVKNRDIKVSFEEVESLFKKDSPAAYVELIDSMIDGKYETVESSI